MAPNQEVPSPAASELEAPAAGSPGGPALLRMGAPASSAPAGEGEQPAHASEAEQALPADSTPAPGPAQGLDLAEYSPARGTITLAATPIGNRGDASPRLMAALALADGSGAAVLANGAGRHPPSVGRPGLTRSGSTFEGRAQIGRAHV